MSSIYNAYIPEEPYKPIPEENILGQDEPLSGLLRRFHLDKPGHGELLVLLVFLLLLREGDRSDALLTLGIAVVLFLLDDSGMKDGSIRQGESDFLI